MTDIIARLHEYALDWRVRAGSKDIVDEAIATISDLRTALANTPAASSVGAVPAILAMPVPLPGHWDTAEGRDIASECVTQDRARIAYGNMSDFALANAVFMASRDDLDLIVWQTAAKERIRWLSAQLALAASSHPASAGDENIVAPAPGSFVDMLQDAQEQGVLAEAGLMSLRPGQDADVLRSLRNLLGSCTRHPVGGGDGGTYTVTAPTWDAIKDASETIRRALSATPAQEGEGA